MILIFKVFMFLLMGGISFQVDASEFNLDEFIGNKVVYGITYPSTSPGEKQLQEIEKTIISGDQSQQTLSVLNRNTYINGTVEETIDEVEYDFLVATKNIRFLGWWLCVNGHTTSGAERTELTIPAGTFVACKYDQEGGEVSWISPEVPWLDLKKIRPNGVIEVLKSYEFGN